MKLFRPFKNLTKFEIILWLCSSGTIIIAFLAGSQRDALTITASLIGVTALIFVAKGEVLGQMLTILFSIFYAVISFQFKYYGEMITYLGMTAPIALLSIISWLKHPYENGCGEVKAARLTKKQCFTLCIFTLIVTFIFYFILKHFNNANLFMSTVSIATSFSASALMMLRSPIYAIAYACNDVVLIILWVMTSSENAAFIPMIICFSVFFINDMYGFFNWQRMIKRQNQ